MLYERWEQVVQAHANETALTESWSGQSWTFAALADAAKRLPVPVGSCVFPTGRTHSFILNVLQAWREKRICCPLEESQPQPQIPPLPDGCIHLKLTSGSTGEPRLIGFTGGQMAADAANIVSTMGLRPGWPNLGAISLAHSYGFSNLVLPLLIHGIPLILMETPLPGTLLNAAKSVPDITLAAVPVLWRTWYESGAIPSNTRLAISAGAPLPLSLEEAVFQQNGLKIHNFYGSSECGGIAYDRTVSPRQNTAYVGSMMDNVQLSLNEEGCLEVSSQAVGLGYFPPEPDRLGKGRFATKDIAEITDGQVTLTGRASDIINVAGRKVAPEAIERALLQHEGVRDCLVFGVPDSLDARGEQIVAVVVGEKNLSNEVLRQHLLSALPSWQIPRDWRFVDSLSTDARGKRPRRQWRESYSKEADRSPT